MTNRKLWILLSLFLLVIAACSNLDDTGNDFSAPDEPNIRLVYTNGIADGNKLVSCWTKGEDNVSCDVAADSAQSTDNVMIGASDVLAVQFEGDVGAPANMAVVVKGIESDGQIVTYTTLKPAVGDTFLLDFVPEGEYRLEITGYYDDIEGSAATYSEVFAITIGEPTVVAVNPTATQDEGASADSDATATSIAATNQALETDSAETAMALASAEATIADAPPTLDATGTQIILDQTATALAEPTEAEVATATVLPTDTDVPEPTATPTELATEAPSATPTLGIPTFVPPATRTPLPPGNTGAPQVNLRVAGVDYEPRATTFCEIAANGTETCNDETIQVDLIRSATGRAVNFIVNGQRPQLMTYRFLTGQVFREVSSGRRTTPSNTYLFNMFGEPGIYVIEIEIFYENSHATYVYQAQIQ